MIKLQPNDIKMIGDIPSPRFGHSFTLVNNNKAVLFGGAIGQSGKFIITNQTFTFDLNHFKWTKLNCFGDVPSQRAAHAASAFSNNYLSVFGGAASGVGGLTEDDLFLLDIREQNNPKWTIVPVQKKNRKTPGKRYGHTMVYSKPLMVVFGGNIGNNNSSDKTSSLVNDTWIINMEKNPFYWQKYQFTGPIPQPRVYHSAALCSQGSAGGMIVIFGGRVQNSSDKKKKNQPEREAIALNDCWGLRRHRDNRVDWVQAPYKKQNPTPRYQHWIQFIGSLMVVVGGRTNQALMKQSVYDDPTMLIELYDTQTSQWTKVNAVNRYRHTLLCVKSSIFVHGGFQPALPNQPLSSMIEFDLSKLGYINQRFGKYFNNLINDQNTFNKMNQSHFAKSQIRQLTPTSRVIKSTNKTIRLANQAIVATSNNGERLSLQIRKVPLDQLQQQHRKLMVKPISQSIPKYISLVDMFLNTLLPPIKVNINGPLQFKKEFILKLCEQVKKVFESQPMLIRIRPPVKIFGNLYGRYCDLMRFFENFGYPDEQELEIYDYLFLGNYVSKGFNSLELVCLLFSLKLKYPEHFYLLRGNYEDLRMNKIFGLAEECTHRLNQNINDYNSVYQNLNRVFEMMPLAALIDGKFLCVHSGIGNELKQLQQIENISRPLNLAYKKSKIAVDILWSQYVRQGHLQDSKDILNYGQTKFNQDRLDSFLNDNSLSLIIRSHDVIQQGFENNIDGIITIFSCTNYGGKYKNNAAILKIKKNQQLIPQIIQSLNKKEGAWLPDNGFKGQVNLSDQQYGLRKRQYTPPRTKQ